MTQPFSRILYMGTPEFAVLPLEAMLQKNLPVIGVVCQPDKPKGRGKKLSAPAVKTVALREGLPVFQPKRLKGDALDKLLQLKPDLIVVCAYGKLLPSSLLKAPQEIINIHASLLPKYRGASPIHQAIRQGETQTGISIMKVVQEMDAGPTMLQVPVDIDPDDTLSSLYQKLAKVGASALIQALDLFERGEVTWKEQDPSMVTFAPKIHSEDTVIDWKQPLDHVVNFIRSLSPDPGASTQLNDTPIKILEVKPATHMDIECGLGQFCRTKKNLFVGTSTGTLEILRLQPPGKKDMRAVDFLNGFRGDIDRCA